MISTVDWQGLVGSGLLLLALRVYLKPIWVLLVASASDDLRPRDRFLVYMVVCWLFFYLPTMFLDFYSVFQVVADAFIQVWRRTLARRGYGLPEDLDARGLGEFAQNWIRALLEWWQQRGWQWAVCY